VVDGRAKLKRILRKYERKKTDGAVLAFYLIVIFSVIVAGTSCPASLSVKWFYS
jgi:hypothetical protein